MDRNGGSIIYSFTGEMIYIRWIWIRHGETEHNAAKRYLGHLNLPLNQRGREQAANLVSSIQKEAPDVVYSSDLQRCLETAAPFCSTLGLHPVPTAALRELNFGEWDGLTYEDIYHREPKRMQVWLENPFDTAPPGGETMKALGSRVDLWLYELKASMKEGESAVIICHGGVIRWFQSKWILGDTSQFWNVQGLSHGEGFVFEWKGETGKVRNLER